MRLSGEPEYLSSNIFPNMVALQKKPSHPLRQPGYLSNETRGFPSPARAEFGFILYVLHLYIYQNFKELY